MGVQGLWKLLESTGRPVNPETLEGKILAVDISIWLNQAVKGARDRQGNAIQNAHLLTLFHRLCKLLFFRIRPIFVFDGEAPGLKKRTLAIRRQRKNAATQDSSKTTEKLLKTFLKRQAIKAVLTGKSDEVIPSLSQVRREEVDDIYRLPALEEPEKNSSDEEEEKEWEERITQKQVLQEEFLEDPHSVDIESEDFISLPPEVKHEILTDLKELTKRRRTIFETMPEESNDFSQYQLKGLLKKNTLNRHIDNVQKEMNQQSSGDIQALYENEGGFLKNVESRKVMSEDAAHYVLIKGLQSKKEVNQKDLSLSSSSTIGNDPPCKEITHNISTGSQPPSLVKPDTEECTVDVAPPSPRTLLAIQTAMMESSSDEETVGENNISSVVCYKTEPVNLGVPHIGNSEGNLSPRTFHAIQQALTEEIDETFDGVGGTLSNMSNKDKINSPGSNVILITSSDEEDAVPISIAEEKIALTVATSNSTCPKNIELDQRSSVIQRHILVNAEKSAANVPGEITAASVDSEVIEIKEQCSLDLKCRKDMEIKEHLDLECKSLTDKSHNKLTGAECTGKDLLLPIHISSLDSDDLKTEFHTKLLESNGVLSNVLQTDEESLLPTHVVSVISGRNSIVEEEVNDEAIQSKESDSESDDGFIEVDSGLSDNSMDLSEPEIALKAAPATISHPPGEAAPILDRDVSVKEMDDTIVDGASDWVEPIQPEAEAAEDHEAAVNEWHDISLEELETLESNLLVQQGTLQAQKQQQERIAATVTGQMYLESQELLRLFGVPYIVAPTEAEAQCAILDLTDQTSGTITDDSDIWLFGARHVYKNFFSHNKYVEYYQYVDIHNQLGLDRNKLINLAYLLGSDYTDGIPTVGCVTAMEILNEFPGHGLQPLIEFRNWWAEAQKNKKIRANPNDTKVKKKLRELELHQAFPNLAVAEAYLKPIVDDGKGAFSWGRPDLEQIREFCATAFGWYRSKTDDILLPVLKQLNAQQTQLRIDSFFRMEQHEKQAIKSQRLRRAVICMQRKEREGEIPALEEAIPVIDEKFKSPEKKKGKRTVQDTTTRLNCETGKRKKAANSQMQNLHGQVGGFFDVSRIPENESGSSNADPADETTNVCRGKQPLGTQKTINLCKKTAIKDKWKSGGDKNISSSSGEDEPEVKTVMVTARSVFENKAGKSKSVRGRKKKN